MMHPDKMYRYPTEKRISLSQLQKSDAIFSQLLHSLHFHLPMTSPGSAPGREACDFDPAAVEQSWIALERAESPEGALIIFRSGKAMGFTCLLEEETGMQFGFRLNILIL